MSATATTIIKGKKIHELKNGKEADILHSQISLPRRPKAGEETSVFFFNPRPLTEVKSPEKLKKLIKSIRFDGLMEALVVNVVQSGVEIDQIELLAGERRYWAVSEIISKNFICTDFNAEKPEQFAVGQVVSCKGFFGTVVEHVDNKVTITYKDEVGKEEFVEALYEETLPTGNGRDLFESVCCKIYFNLSNEAKLRIAWAENDNSERLSVSAEIQLVERLIGMKYKQKEIVDMLGSNNTFVSQRAAFRTELPQMAFEYLMADKMAANTGIFLLSLPPEQREEAFHAALKLELQDHNNQCMKLKTQLETSLDEMEQCKNDIMTAQRNGDLPAANAATRKMLQAKVLVERFTSKIKKLEKEKGSITQNHVEKGAAVKNVKPKKKRILSKNLITDLYVIGMMCHLKGTGKVDEVTGEVIPREQALLVKMVAVGILEGELDPTKIIREYNVKMGQWVTCEETEPESEDEFE